MTSNVASLDIYLPTSIPRVMDSAGSASSVGEIGYWYNEF